jgi:hypothetical protein
MVSPPFLTKLTKLGTPNTLTPNLHLGLETHIILRHNGWAQFILGLTTAKTYANHFLDAYKTVQSDSYIFLHVTLQKFKATPHVSTIFFHMHFIICA